MSFIEKDDTYRGPLLRQVAHTVNSNRIRKIIEFSCGRGDNIAYLQRKIPNVEFSGIDVNEVAIGVAKRRFESIHFQVGKIPLEVLTNVLKPMNWYYFAQC